MIRRIVILTLSCLIAAGWAYWAMAWRAARDFFSAEETGADYQPSISILKPVKGIDAQAYENFSSFCRQEYDNYEVLFAVSDPRDPAVAVIRRLQKDSPNIAIQLFISDPLGANPKCANLHCLAAEAKGDVLVISDGDIRVTSDYLRRVVQPLADQAVGIVTCPYRGLLPTTVVARLESLHMDAVFLPAVILAHQLGHRVGMGATMVVRRADLSRAGGFAAIADYLMDDYQLAQLIENLGLRTHLSHYIVGSVLGATTFGQQYKREVRWSRGIRVTCPGKYWGLLVTFPIAWALILLVVGGFHLWSAGILISTLLWRWVVSWDVRRAIRSDSPVNPLLLIVRDGLGLIVWSAGVFGRGIEWRGQRFILQSDGRLLSDLTRLRASLLVPSPPYSGERVRVSGHISSCTARETVPHPNPLPRVRGRGSKAHLPRNPGGVTVGEYAHPTLKDDRPARNEGIFAKLFNRLVRRLDAYLRRREGIFEFCTDETCVLRASVGVINEPISLADSTTLSPGDVVCDLHLFNDHVPRIGPAGPGIAWGHSMQKALRYSLAKLAVALECDDRLASVIAVRAQTNFVTRGRTLRRMAESLHFQPIDLHETPGFWTRAHEMGENLLIWALVRTFNPGGLRNAKLVRRRHQFFVSRRMLIEQYGRESTTKQVGATP